jgi:hypothetical protein
MEAGDSRRSARTMAEMIELADDDDLELMRSRAQEQEVLDMLDEPATR